MIMDEWSNLTGKCVTGGAFLNDVIFPIMYIISIVHHAYDSILIGKERILTQPTMYNDS